MTASAQSPPTQLDRIEQKLDTILHRMDELRPSLSTPAHSASAVVLFGPECSAPCPEPLLRQHRGRHRRLWPPVRWRSSTLRPATAVAAHEIPADSVGGFIYTGGSLQLADLKDHGVHYTGLTGVEWQGWLRARDSGRYEL